MNRTLVLVVGLGAFACGFGVGILAHRRAASTEGIQAAPNSGSTLPPMREVSTSGNSSDVENETVALKKQVRDLESQIHSLRESPRRPPEVENNRDFAERLFEDYLELNSRRATTMDPEKARGFLGRLGRLDDQSSEYFIERYRKAVETEDGRHEKAIALELALAAGGPKTSEFVNVLLNDATLDPILRANLLSEISGISGSFFSIKRLPISPGLEGTAMTLARSENPEERRGAAGLLGGVRNEIARSELRRIVEQDGDLRAKAAAVLSLGHVGDVATRTYLETLWASQSPSFSGEEGARVRRATEAAIKELSGNP